MFCKNCGTKVEEETKFCGNCGEQIKNNAELQSIKKEEKIEEKGEILHIISGINNPSMTFSGANGHWSIIFIEKAVFFVKNSSSSWYQGNPGVVLGVVGATGYRLAQNAIINKLNKKDSNEIDINNLFSILEHSKKYYKFETDKLNKIRVKKTWRNNTIFLDGVESSTLEINVPKLQYEDFILNVKNIFKYNFAKEEDK